MKYKYLKVRKIALDELRSQPKERKLSARQQAAAERDTEIRSALNEAAALPAGEAIAIELGEGQKMPTPRAAIDRLVRAEPRKLNWGIRGTRVVISKGEIPGGRRGRRKTASSS